MVYSYGRHQNNTLYSEETLLNSTLDSRNRYQQEDEENIAV